MNAAAVPRPGQIEVLVGGWELPLPPVDPEILEVVAEAIEHAMHTLSADGHPELRNGTEAEVNGLVRGRLNAFLNRPDPADQRGVLVRALWRQLVTTVTLGQETPSHDGGHLEKRPDLNIHLTGGHPSLPLVAECKLIDAANAKTPRKYCNEGVARFPRGDYGWASREAFMVAYVRDGSGPLPSLARLLCVPQSPNAPGPLHVLQPLSVFRDDACVICRSTHGRVFNYAAGNNAGGEARANRTVASLADRATLTNGLAPVKRRPVGKGIVFITIEDETGLVNPVLWANRFEAQRRLVMSARVSARDGIHRSKPSSRLGRVVA